MRLDKTLALALVCAATLLLPLAGYSAQAPRARAQAAAPQTTITEEKLKAILLAIDKAAQKKDVDGIAAHMAADVRIKMKVGEHPTRQLNRAQYVLFGKKGFEIVLDYDYIRYGTTISIDPDGQSATVRAQIFETLTFAQGTVSAVTEEVSVFKVRKGKILMTSMEGVTTRP